MGAVLVLGGGVSGIQASLDLGSLGFKVYLVETSRMIGGRMAQLDKTFPTGDCSMCILSPKMIECNRHPNIKILSYTDIKTVEGEPGNFRVTLTRKPRYVREDRCVGCRICSSYCPVRVDDPFNEKLSLTKCISVFCPQAIPAVSAINADNCLFLREGKCKICAPTCKQRAIDFTQREQDEEIVVGAIIVSTGYEIFDAKISSEYGYGRMKNVITSMDFERVLNADGPYHGEVVRPSDGKVPRKIAWLQCVGSRSRRDGHAYCSSVCCTYAAKQVLLVKDHYPEVESTVFFTDMRTFGKGFEAFSNRAQALEGVRFIRRRVSSIKENKQTRDLIIRYVTEDNGTVMEEEFELVVLSIGMVPNKTNETLAAILGISLNAHGFCTTNAVSPNQTGRKGIYPAATFTAPMDIPDSVSSATGAVSLAAQLLAGERGSLAQARSFPPERVVGNEEARIGVFVCRCGANIGRVVDVSAVAESAKKLDQVVFAGENLFSCSADTGRLITQKIKEHGLNRVVVAACTPRTHEGLFQDTLREAGINKYLFELANIREHCSWVHSHEKEKATEKAKDIVRMAVERVKNLTPLEEIEVPVINRGVVIGGGLAGMTAALALARQGFQVHLIEREFELGGNLRTIHYTIEGLDVAVFLAQLTAEVDQEDKITVLKGYELKTFSGSVGNFKSVVSRVGESDEKQREEIDHGILIVATGGRELKPHEYGYGTISNVITQQELEDKISSGEATGDLRQVAMIQCAGARSEEHVYCGRICCGEALKNALKLKEVNKDIEVIIFYRDIRAYGFLEDYYNEAREKGILFVRYDPGHKPEVRNEGEELCLKFYDPVLSREDEIRPDMVVLSAPVEGKDNEKLSQILRVPITDDGFFMEAHMKLRPLDFASEGVFLCGLAHYPKFIRETISQANGAAARAAVILSQKTMKSSGAVAVLKRERCIGCGICVAVCPYSAFNVEDTSVGPRAMLAPGVCRGCGTCVARCPRCALSLNHFTDTQIFGQIGAVA
ncbi:MAG TPA: FAD-dependent oxidoreductase [Thermodesulfobacteriota bacterium]|nr:FAD-dependent oxidoreductase [Thermodesulfobacteriota bacterium]